MVNKPQDLLYSTEDDLLPLSVDVRRITACINVCRGIHTEDLENSSSGAAFFGRMAGKLCTEKQIIQKRITNLEAQNKELKAKYEGLIHQLDQRSWKDMWCERDPEDD